MSGYYDQATVELMNHESFALGRASMEKNLWATATVAFFIGMAVPSITTRLTGNPSSVASSPELAPLIGAFRGAKDNSEEMVRSVKARRQAGTLSEDAYAKCSTDYRELSSQFNGALVTLEAMLSTGYDDNSARVLSIRLNEAQQAYGQFRTWFKSLPEYPVAKPKPSRKPKSATQQTYGALVDVAPVIGDLAKHVLSSLAQMEKERKEHLIILLRQQQFQKWSDLTEQ